MSMENQTRDSDLESSQWELQQQFVSEQNDPAEQAFRLALIHHASYQSTSSIADINQAVNQAKYCVSETADDNPLLSRYWDILGLMLIARYRHLHEPEDIEEAITASRQAVKFSSEQDPKHVGILSNLADGLSLEFERTRNIPLLREAIEINRCIVDITVGNLLRRPTSLHNLSLSQHRLYEQEKQMAHLEIAMENAHQAAEQSLPSDPNRRYFLHHLGTLLRCRYERTREIRDLDSAVDKMRQAALSTPERHHDKAGFFSDLGDILKFRYHERADMQDLEEGLQAAQKAVDIVVSNGGSHPRHCDFLTNLANIIESRFEQTGNLHDLEKAIKKAQDAVKLTDVAHPSRPLLLNNLGVKRRKMYERTGELQELDTAIDAQREAVKLSQINDPGRPDRLSNLGYMLKSRYERSDTAQDLKDAVKFGLEAVHSPTKDNHRHAAYFSELGNILGTEYDRTKEINNLLDAIRAAKKAVRLTLPGHPVRAARLSNLSVKLQSLFYINREMEPLQAARDALEEAVKLTPPNHHSDMAAILINLGDAYKSQFDLSGDMEFRQKACESFLKAWECRAATPFHRIRAAADCLKLLPLQGKTKIAAQIAMDVIDLLGIVNTRFLNLANRQFIMSEFSGIAATACAVLLERQNPEAALQCLERGRTVILSHIMNDRSEISALKQSDPQIAGRYEELLAEINTSLQSPEDGLISTHLLERRQTAIAEIDMCIQEIRSRKGHERFMLGQTISQMRACATEGLIAIINITNLRSDAILVSSRSIQTIQLQQMSQSEARSWLKKKWSGSRNELGAKNKEYGRYLSWLWNSCVKHVLEAAALVPTDGQLPRIWWIGTALASSMPFHAAGIHSSNPTENVYCRAISSYTPSIRALAHARDSSPSAIPIRSGLLIATMETTPGGLSDLPNVVEEVKVVSQTSSAHILVNKLEQPSTQQVTDYLEDCSIAHFACHGYTHHSDPSKSGLVFRTRDQSGGFIKDILTVKAISELHLKHARLAYLSACSTAENSVPQLADEVIHVVSGFQVAGFPHVVGCLWPSTDRICVEVANDFYKTLLQDEGIGLVNKDVPAALQKSVLTVRDQYPKQPLKWAQFVHFGA